MKYAVGVILILVGVGLMNDLKPNDIMGVGSLILASFVLFKF